jgi:hypothetical protein
MACFSPHRVTGFPEPVWRNANSSHSWLPAETCRLQSVIDRKSQQRQEASEYRARVVPQPPRIPFGGDSDLPKRYRRDGECHGLFLEQGLRPHKWEVDLL